MDYSFSEAEKRFVVAEMIKASQINLESIVGFYKQQGVQPDWCSMQIPSGRNIYQCVEAARSLGIRVDQPSNPLLHAQHDASLKRKSPSDFDAPGPKRPAVAPSLEPASTAAPYTRIQPRPPHNGYTGMATGQGPQVTPTGTGRKRGRPSKADREAQARANAPSSFAPISPAPLAPTVPHFTPQDHGAVASAPAYRTSPGPSDFASRRGSRPLSADRTQPRGLPPYPSTAYDPVERSPAPPERRLSPMEPAIDNPAVHEVGRRLGPRDRAPSDHRPKDSGPSQAAAAEQMKKESPKAINMPA